MMDIPLHRFITLTIAAAFDAKDKTGFLSSRVEFDLAINVVSKEGKSEVYVIDGQDLPNANRIRFGLDVNGL